MRIFSIVIFLSAIIYSCNSQKEESQGTDILFGGPNPNELPVVEDCGYVPNPSEFEGWIMIFEDNFDGNLSKWTAWHSGAFNQELQFYRPNNARTKNDFLYLKSERTTVTGRSNPFDETIKSFDFASGRIESIQEFGPEPKTAQERVRFSARLRLVSGHGLWPAWWSYNDPWPTKGEIDILEATGDSPFEFKSNFHYGRNVNQVETDPVFNDFHYTHTEDLSECFHLYELEWSRDEFVIKFDGKVVKSYDVETYEFVDDFFNKKHRLTLNLAVGGWFIDNLNISEIPDEAYLVVDWVRVYTQ